MHHDAFPWQMQRICTGSTATREYGATENKLTTFARRIHGKINKDHKAGKLHNCIGNHDAVQNLIRSVD